MGGIDAQPAEYERRVVALRPRAPRRAARTLERGHAKTRSSSSTSSSPFFASSCKAVRVPPVAIAPSQRDARRSGRPRPGRRSRRPAAAGVATSARSCSTAEPGDVLVRKRPELRLALEIVELEHGGRETASCVRRAWASGPDTALAARATSNALPSFASSSTFAARPRSSRSSSAETFASASGPDAACSASARCRCSRRPARSLESATSTISSASASVAPRLAGTPTTSACFLAFLAPHPPTNLRRRRRAETAMRARRRRSSEPQ